MNHIEQLKQIRSEALARIRESQDYQLAVKLGALIVDLGDNVEDRLETSSSRPAAPAMPMADVTNLRAATETKPEIVSDDAMVNELVAGMKEDVAAEGDKRDSNVVGPVLKAHQQANARSNGSAA